MSQNKLQKISASILILSQLALPGIALAQLSGIASAGTVPTSDSANGSGGITGAAANTIAVGQLELQDKLNQSAAAGEATYFKGDSNVQISFGGLSLISGGASVVAQLDAKISAIEGFITTRQIIRNSLMSITAPNIFTATRKQTLLNEVDNAITSLKNREEQIKQQETVAKQGLWRTLVFNILLKTTKSVSTKLVNSLVTNYGIKNFTNYADAVATQVYDNQFIEKNSKNHTDQIIIRSMLDNPLAQNQIQPAVLQYADVAMGFNPDTLDTNDPNYYAKLAGVTNPALYNAAFVGNAQQVRAQSLAAAQTEIAQSNGLKTPRNCAGTMTEQQSIDRQFKAANDYQKDRQALYNNLTSAKKMGSNVSDEDIKKAQADLASANAQLQAVPTKTDNTLVDICTGIVSPPSLISKGIDEAFKATGQKLGTYNDNNLPVFISLITDVASQIGNDMIFGGQTGNSNILNETAGSLAKATSLTVGFAASKAGEAIDSGIQFYEPEKSPNFPDAYTLSWEIITSKLPTASYVTIKGTGISDTNKLALSGSAEVRTSANSDYTLKVFDKSGKQLGIDIIELSVASVKGAFAAKPVESLRGPINQTGNQVKFQPRGAY